MRQLPSGTVTFLFTDIEGSTRLLEELGDAYADVLGPDFEAARARGRELTLDEAVALARES